jgi:hypothetical protein
VSLGLTAHCHVRPIGRSGCRGSPPPWLTVLPEGSTCPSGEEKVSWGGWALWWRHGARARQKNAARDTHLAWEPSARLGWDGVCHSCLRRLTCYIRAFGESVLLGPNDGALVIMQGAVFCHLLGTLVFWYLTNKYEQHAICILNCMIDELASKCVGVITLGCLRAPIS